MASSLDGRFFAEAKRYIPGGVNSPVRSFKTVGPPPVFMKRGRGARLYAEDGRAFIDYCLSYGAHIFGHASAEIVKAAAEAVRSGSSFGAPTKKETELAGLVGELVPSVELLRLTNSGTEAVMSALRLSRAYTRRDKILRFEGCYHGHADFLVGGDGIPEHFRAHTLTCAYNDLKAVKKIFEKQGPEIAAVIVEPVAANMGVVLPAPGFLEFLRKITTFFGALLVFDEVITGFRLGLAGAQGFFGIRPDLSCFGKILGGGFPVGAFGGRKDILRLLAPEGPVYQAGTFSGNPVTVAAGLEALEILKKKKPYEAMAQKTLVLCQGLQQALAATGLKARINHISSLFSVFFSGEDVTNYSSARRQDAERFRRFHRGLLEEGIYFAPSCFEADFLSVAHTEVDMMATVASAAKVFKKLKR